MKSILVILFSIVCLLSCEEKQSINSAPQEISAGSIFDLHSNWQNQQGREIQLKELKGKNLVVAMIFTSCTTACPILVSEMKKIESKLDNNSLKKTNLVLISIDPDNDTPEVLYAYAKQNNIDKDPWILLRSDKESVRELANVLAVKYKKITPIIFSHSNIITVFNKNGEMVTQLEGVTNSEEIAKSVNNLNQKK